MTQCMKKEERHLATMLKPESLYQSFGLIFILLVSIGVISFTSKFIFGSGSMKVTKISDQIYDPDRGRNFTQICPFTTNTHRIQYNRTVCFNRTMRYWYIPWVHYDIWRDFDENISGKRMERLRKLEKTREAEDKEGIETSPEGVAEEVAMSTDTPSNRKVKDEPSKVVCTILAALLVISSAVAFCEVFRDKWLTKTRATTGASKQSLSYGNPSLNELIKQTPGVLRQEPFQSTAKVTQTLVHQSSLDRAFSRLSSEGVKPLFRRSSVPAQMMSSGVGEATTFFRGQPPGYSQQMTPSDSPETRRKSRHFIRRH